MPQLEREEYIEQAYFFSAFRERMEDGHPAQDILGRIGEELLSTTNLPRAVSYMQAESKLTGLIAPAMQMMPHYFAPFQTFVIKKAESETGRFEFSQALLILEREARYRSDGATRAGMFVYQFETLSRNRLGYREGLAAMSRDDLYDEDWSDFIKTLLARLGDVDFADLIFIRSLYYLNERRRKASEYQPKFPILFGEKEGKIARAHRGRDPSLLFMALQRQLGYPEVPRPRRFSESEAKVVELEQRVLQLENRLKLLDNEIHGQEVDINSLMVKPGETAGVPSGWGKKAQVEAHPPAPDRIKSGGGQESETWDFQYPPMS
jgi:hypothetical protein